MLSCGASGVFVGIGATIKDAYNCGSAPQSWGYMSTGHIYGCGSIVQETVPYWDGDKIALYYRVDKGVKELFLFKNGECLGSVAHFKNNPVSGTPLNFQITYYTNGDLIAVNSNTIPYDIY